MISCEKNSKLFRSGSPAQRCARVSAARAVWRKSPRIRWLIARNLLAKRRSSTAKAKRKRPTKKRSRPISTASKWPSRRCSPRTRPSDASLEGQFTQFRNSIRQGCRPEEIQKQRRRDRGQARPGRRRYWPARRFLLGYLLFREFGADHSARRTGSGADSCRDLRHAQGHGRQRRHSLHPFWLDPRA